MITGLSITGNPVFCSLPRRMTFSDNSCVVTGIGSTVWIALLSGAPLMEYTDDRNDMLLVHRGHLSRLPCTENCTTTVHDVCVTHLHSRLFKQIPFREFGTV
jgi:hypothetical protein